MYRVEELQETNRKCVLELLGSDVVRHVFAFYDVQFDPEHSLMHVAFDKKELKGYLLVYTGLEFPSIILECEIDAAETLLSHAPKDGFIMHAPLSLLPAITKTYPSSKTYAEEWMIVRKGEQKCFTSKHVRRLNPKRDASQLAKLLSTRGDRSKPTAKKCSEWISKMPIYGVFIQNKLVSYAGSFLQLPQVWMIGGVYTHPNHRSKGYATLATSAVTEEALKSAAAAALFARSDNASALKAYSKIGYQKLGNKVWVDVGTGMKP